MYRLETFRLTNPGDPASGFVSSVIDNLPTYRAICSYLQDNSAAVHHIEVSHDSGTRAYTGTLSDFRHLGFRLLQVGAGCTCYYDNGDMEYNPKCPLSEHRGTANWGQTA
jgi:hypothetical protein